MNRNAANRQDVVASGRAGKPSVESRSVDAVLPRTSSSDSETWSDVEARPVSTPLSAHRLNSEVWRLVLTDKLTGLCNRHGFVALADQQWRMSRRANREMVFVKFELGNLQQIRESLPRGESDLALIALARTLMKTFRRSDVLCRWDGGEFVALAVDAEGLSEPMLRARMQSVLRKTAGQIAGFSMIVNARVTRVNPRGFVSLEEALSCLDRDFAGFKRTWFGTDSGRPMIVARETPQ